MGFSGSNRIVRLLLFMFLLMVMPGRTEANTSSEPFDRGRWERLRKNVDYTENPPELKELPERKGWNIPENIRSIIQIALIAIVVAALIALTLQIILRSASGSGKVRLSDIHTEEIDELFTDRKNVEQMYREALKNHDYRLALRYFYILLLQELSERKLIVLQRDKTNHQYLQELRHNELFGELASVTYLFEAVWFGEKRIDAGLFSQTTESCKALNLTRMEGRSKQ